MKNIGEKCVLSDLKVGQQAKVLDVLINETDLKIHLLEMGIVKDTVVKIKKVAPIGEPIVVELRGYELYLRKHELKKIYVEVLI